GGVCVGGEWGGGCTRKRPLQYATAGAVEPRITTLPGGAGANSVSATTGSATAATSQWPADFDATEFARHAKLNFVRMQEAHDRRDLSAMREFLTPGRYPGLEAGGRAARPRAP